jgi:translation elongation factor EF-1alpha
MLRAAANPLSCPLPLDFLLRAQVVDRQRASRDAGRTVDLGMAKMETHRFSLTIIDVPGHRDQVKNMIAGTCQVGG